MAVDFVSTNNSCNVLYTKVGDTEHPVQTPSTVGWYHDEIGFLHHATMSNLEQATHYNYTIVCHGEEPRVWGNITSLFYLWTDNYTIFEADVVSAEMYSNENFVLAMSSQMIFYLPFISGSYVCLFVLFFVFSVYFILFCCCSFFILIQSFVFQNAPQRREGLKVAFIGKKNWCLVKITIVKSVNFCYFFFRFDI